MGDNHDLTAMLGVPNELECPRCRRMAPQLFDDFDVECGHPNIGGGCWELGCYCRECGAEWTYTVDLRAADKKLERIKALISKYGFVDGSHHKQWILDQVMRIIFDCPKVNKTGALGENEKYIAWADGDWDEGVPP